MGATYYYGTAATPLCPGTAMTTGGTACAAEFWSIAVFQFTVSVEQSSWGSIKTLYR